MNEILDQEYGGYSKEISRDFFRSVYSYMVGALVVSGVVAYLTGTPQFVFEYLINPQTGTYSGLFWLILFAPVGIALLIQWGYQRLSLGVLTLLFGAYSVMIGLMFSVVLMAYSGTSVAITFFVTAGAFGAMAVLGYTTKTDLTKMGSLLYMLFIGIFIASIVNIFLGSSVLDLLISIIGVFVFTGLTAFYMQRLKDVSYNTSLSGLDRNKLALVGGLQLYILFVNLFMSLLRLIGRD